MTDTRASIRTRYLGPTDHRGSRVSASDDGHLYRLDRRRIVVTWDDGLGPAENHEAAAREWLGRFIPGSRIVSPGLAFDGSYYWTWEGVSR